jgi:predicted membrane-bound mannosyltransferase
VLALVAGRSVHGLLSVLPMVVGAAYGAGFARRRGPPTRPADAARRPLRCLRRAGVGLLAAVVLLGAVAVAGSMPATLRSSTTMAPSTRAYSTPDSWPLLTAG